MQDRNIHFEAIRDDDERGVPFPLVTLSVAAFYGLIIALVWWLA